MRGTETILAQGVLFSTHQTRKRIMNRILIATAIAASLIGTATAVEAASSKQERSYDHRSHARLMSTSPAVMRPAGPSWAMPNECYTDEGYGRYRPCGAGIHLYKRNLK